MFIQKSRQGSGHAAVEALASQDPNTVAASASRGIESGGHVMFGTTTTSGSGRSIDPASHESNVLLNMLAPGIGQSQASAVTTLHGSVRMDHGPHKPEVRDYYQA